MKNYLQLCLFSAILFVPSFAFAGIDPCDFDFDADGIYNCQDNCINIANPTQADCDNDGVGDVCEIADGSSQDTNNNEIPDECENSPDLNNDGVVNGADLALILGAWGDAGGSADLDDDGTVSGADLAYVLGAWS